MPLVRSCGNIPADLRQEANANLTFDEGAGDRPAKSVGRPRTRMEARREARENGNDCEQVRRIVDESLCVFREEMAHMMAEGFRNLNLGNQGQVGQQDQAQQMETDHGGYRDDQSIGSRDNRRNGGFLNIDRDFDRNSERVLNLIRNWRIRFTGDTSEVTVDEFIYRVNTLTNANLRGDFKLLCEHSHILFEGKALKWFWRFHRSCGIMDWDELCDALKRQYKDYNSDFDIKDDILRRKQKHNESFDDYYDAIMILCDRLRTPLSENELCEIIQRNIKPEVRHELLHMEINRVAQLRRAVRRHEKFVQDMTSTNSNKRPYQKTQVSEVIADDNQTDQQVSLEKETEICLVIKSGKCWNCDKVGHTFIDCIEQRTLFCYGCGAKNIYKPNCVKCQGNFSGDIRALKNGYPKRK